MKYRIIFIADIPCRKCFRYEIEHDNSGAPCYIQCFDESGGISIVINWITIFLIEKIS